jgi:hypothetical protein
MGVTQRYNDKVKSHSKIPNPKRQTNAKLEWLMVSGQKTINGE